MPGVTFKDVLAGVPDVSTTRPSRFLAEPTPRERTFLVISADDHLVEPAHMFEGRMPSKLADAAPRVIEDGATQCWLIDGRKTYFVGGDGVVGRELAEPADFLMPMRYDQLRPATYDADARVRDMDIAGVWASVTFPSIAWGFCGQRAWQQRDPEVALATVRAYNDWVAEEWAGRHPARLVATQITYMPDPVVAAEEVRRNAARGFKAVSFSENPEHLGLPSIHSGHWDPFFAACEETGTVINLHLGSSSNHAPLSSDAPMDVFEITFPAVAMAAAADWLYSKVPVRYPGLKIVSSEGAIGWVPMLIDRIERAHRLRGELWGAWEGDLSPLEVFHRQFWFTTIEDPAGFALRDRIGVDRIMLEADYPHPDTTWPDTQAAIAREVEGLSAEEIRLVTHANAAELYRHPLPADDDWLR